MSHFMMQDPKTVQARIFVGSLPTESINNKDVELIFEPFGALEGVLLNRGFGFVQFVNESSAKAAVAANGSIMFRGRLLDVKPARNKTKPPPPHMKMHMHDERDRSPLGVDRDFMDRGRQVSRFPPQERSRFPAAPERANDCEIIVVNKNQTEYAEYVEQKLRRLGLTVDLLFPNEDVPVTRVLSNIANRGCLFAIVIMPQNEEHRSLTINILHGPPQEHRNMPMEDAVALVSRSFDAYVTRDKPVRPSEVPVAPASTLGLSLAERHPESIQVLLNLLAENRMLTVVQYDKLIVHLQGRRDLQLKVELGDAAPSALPMTVRPSSGIALEKQATLQSRILSILNTKAAGASSAGNGAPGPANHPNLTQGPANKPPLLNDPSVQKALTSLMQGDLLRKFAEPR